MANINLSRMTVEALMDLRKRVDQIFLSVVPRLKSSWRGWVGQLPWLAARCERIERKESPTEISRSVRRNLGRPWCKTSLACCCDQTWQETRGFPDRQVSTQGTEKAKVEALTWHKSHEFYPFASF